MAEIVNTNEFRNGMHIQHKGSVWRIVEFQHVKPGKGGAFVRTKLKGLDSGAVVDETFRAGEKFAACTRRCATCSSSTTTAVKPTSWTRSPRAVRAPAP